MRERRPLRHCTVIRASAHRATRRRSRLTVAFLSGDQMASKDPCLLFVSQVVQRIAFGSTARCSCARGSSGTDAPDRGHGRRLAGAQQRSGHQHRRSTCSTRSAQGCSAARNVGWRRGASILGSKDARTRRTRDRACCRWCACEVRVSLTRTGDVDGF